MRQTDLVFVAGVMTDEVYARCCARLKCDREDLYLSEFALDGGFTHYCVQATDDEFSDEDAFIYFNHPGFQEYLKDINYGPDSVVHYPIEHDVVRCLGYFIGDCSEWGW